MPYSTQEYSVADDNRDFNVTLPYLDKADITVRVNGSVVAFSWNNPTQVHIDDAVTLANGDTVEVERTTDIDESRIEFTNRSAFTGTQLNENFDQAIFALQEFQDQRQALVDLVANIELTSGNLPTVNGHTMQNHFLVADSLTGQWVVRSPAIARNKLGLGVAAQWNAHGVAITGGTITGITDLAVADGGTGASTAAAARTNLGLGTSAVLNVTQVPAALGIPQLDSFGRYPPMNGSRITNIFNYGRMSERLAKGTDAGAAYAGNWRDINTIEANAAAWISSLTEDELGIWSFVLTPGTYDIEIRCPANFVQGHIAALYNVTTGQVVLRGNSARATSANSDGIRTNSLAVCVGRFTVSAGDVWRILHLCKDPKPAKTDALGKAADITWVKDAETSIDFDEVYTTVDLWKAIS